MKVKLNLENLNGNAFSLLSAFRRAAQKQKAEPAWITSVVSEAMSGNYDHLLETLLNATEPEED